MSGKLIVIEGLDGSGKQTQTDLLYEEISRSCTPVRVLNFPRYDKESSALVKMYLRGDFGTRPDDVSGRAASVFFACDRFASWRTDWMGDYRKGVNFLCNRYTTSNAVFQTGKQEPSEWDGYLDWLFDFEYGIMGIPRPDIVFYLDVDPEVSEKLLIGRADGDAGRLDIHERDPLYQRHCREAGLYCARREGWKVVDCVREGAILPARDILARILTTLREEGFIRNA